MIDGRNWEVTFSDMLMLLLTFLIFIISVSVFKTDDYKDFWKVYNKGIIDNNKTEGDKASTDSNEINPFPELDIPNLSNNAASILRETNEIINETKELSSLGVGDKIFYNENRISLMISEKIGFGSGKAILQNNIKSLLLNLIPAIQKTEFPVNITGHTDSTISSKVDNLTLSLDRALEIADFMIKNGLDASRVSVSGYGQYRPIYTNLTKEGREKNRRVQIDIIINRQNKVPKN